MQAIEIEIAGAQNTLATKHDIVALKQEIASLKQEIASLKQDILVLRHEMEEKISALRIEFHAAMTGNVRHMYGALAGQFALLLGLAYFFVSHLQH